MGKDADKRESWKRKAILLEIFRRRRCRRRCRHFCFISIFLLLVGWTMANSGRRVEDIDNNGQQFHSIRGIRKNKFLSVFFIYFIFFVQYYLLRRNTHSIYHVAPLSLLPLINGRDWTVWAVSTWTWTRLLLHRHFCHTTTIPSPHYAMAIPPSSTTTPSQENKEERSSL